MQEENKNIGMTNSRGLSLAIALSMGAAISLGITRFAYGLLLPSMRTDLNWSYTLAGAMNTFNALGYLVGALATPFLMKRFGVARLLLVSSVLASIFMVLSGFFLDSHALLLQRFLAGVASAWIFVCGGLMAARLGTSMPGKSGLVLGLYYGGAGFGIFVSALVVPSAIHAAGATSHSWTWAWWALALACFMATAILAWPVGVLGNDDASSTTSSASNASADRFRASRMSFALAGYTLFGAGYIGYMTFVIALLREQGASPTSLTVFYSLLGLAVIASSRIWAGLLDKYRGGQALGILCGLLGVACVLPAITSSWPLILLSGLMFGGMFLSVVASTTALVRHNTPAAQWVAGITSFTIAFAAGQIIGPTIVGWIADGPGGLSRGLIFSACTLWVGSALALRQRPLNKV